MNQLLKCRATVLILLIVPILFLISEPAAAGQGHLLRSVEGTVSKISDGDTITVYTDDGTKLKVRLAGVDCPETPKVNHKTGVVNKPGQPFGEEAQLYTDSIVRGKAVRVDIYDIDQYQRLLAYVFTDDGYNLNLELIRAGLAEIYIGGEYGPYKRELEEAEEEAKSAGRGMWGLGRKYESPKEFRKRLRVSGE